MFRSFKKKIKRENNNNHIRYIKQNDRKLMHKYLLTIF